MTATLTVDSLRDELFAVLPGLGELPEGADVPLPNGGRAVIEQALGGETLVAIDDPDGWATLTFRVTDEAAELTRHELRGEAVDGEEPSVWTDHDGPASPVLLEVAAEILATLRPQTVPNVYSDLARLIPSLSPGRYDVRPDEWPPRGVEVGTDRVAILVYDSLNPTIIEETLVLGLDRQAQRATPLYGECLDPDTPVLLNHHGPDLLALRLQQELDLIAMSL